MGNNDDDYPWIRLYGRCIGSLPEYIEYAVVKKAREQGAPADAIIPRRVPGTGKQIASEWITAREWVRFRLGTVGVNHGYLIDAAREAGLEIPVVQVPAP